MIEYNLKYVYIVENKDFQYLKIKLGETYLFRHRLLGDVSSYTVKNINRDSPFTITHFNEEYMKNNFICFYENRKRKIKNILNRKK